MSDFQIPILAQLVGLLADWMRIALQFCYEMSTDFGLPSYGIAIIVLTILIKIVLLPLAVKQIRSMKAMQELQPKIQEIQKKYKGDRAKISSEMQKLYRDAHVSPLAGCLPLLIQMPFLVSIYYALQGFPYDPAHESFLWLDSLASPDSTYILPVLSALSTWVISWQTTPKNVQGSQKTMLYIMPLFIGYISLSFPSGLVIYWVVCNIFQLIQQTIMFRGEMKEKLAASRKGVVTIHTPRRGEAKKTVKKVAVKKSAKAEKEEEAKKAKAEAKRAARKARAKAAAEAKAAEEAAGADEAPKAEMAAETPQTEAPAETPKAETPAEAPEAEAPAEDRPAAPQEDAPAAEPQAAEKAPETDAAEAGKEDRK